MNPSVPKLLRRVLLVLLGATPAAGWDGIMPRVGAKAPTPARVRKESKVRVNFILLFESGNGN